MRANPKPLNHSARSSFQSILLLILPSSALLLLLSGCLAIKPVTPTTTYFDAPLINQMTEKELGDTIIDKGIMRTYEAISISEEVKGRFGLARWTASPGTFPAVGSCPSGVLFRAPRPIIISGLFGSSPAEGGVIISDNASSHVVMYIFQEGRHLMSAPLELGYQRTQSNEVLPGSFRRELIYNGRTGTVLKFLYRELKDQAAGAPFMQEIIHDLVDGDVIVFKGARLHVEQATDTRIKYKVSKSFD